MCEARMLQVGAGMWINLGFIISAEFVINRLCVTMVSDPNDSYTVEAPYLESACSALGILLET